MLLNIAGEHLGVMIAKFCEKCLETFTMPGIFLNEGAVDPRSPERLCCSHHEFGRA